MSDLERIVKMAELLKDQQEKVSDLEEQLKTAKKERQRLEQEDLPQLMNEVGLQEIKLSDGRVVRVKEEVEAKITDKTRPAALRWLLDNNFGGLIKTQVSVSFPRGDHDTAQQVKDELDSQYEGVQLKEDVHPQTLKAFVREQMGQGKTVPMDLFNVYPYSKAVINKK